MKNLKTQTEFDNIIEAIYSIELNNELDLFINSGFKEYSIENRLVVAYNLAYKIHERNELINNIWQKYTAPYYKEECELKHLPPPFNTEKLVEEFTGKIGTSMDSMFKINEFINSCLIDIRNKYSLRDINDLLSLKLSIINQELTLFSISPLLFEFEIWKDLINYEITIIELKKVTFTIKNMIFSLKDLKKRLNHNYFYGQPLLDGSESDDLVEFGYQNSGSFYSMGESIDSYINYLEIFDKNSINKIDSNKLIRQISGKSLNEYKPTKELYMRTKKIYLKVSPLHLINFLKNNFNTNIYSLSSKDELYLINMVLNIFDWDLNKFKEKLPMSADGIFNLLNKEGLDLLLKTIILLEKNNFCKATSDSNTFKLIKTFLKSEIVNTKVGISDRIRERLRSHRQIEKNILAKEVWLKSNNDFISLMSR